MLSKIFTTLPKARQVFKTNCISTRFLSSSQLKYDTSANPDSARIIQQLDPNTKRALQNANINSLFKVQSDTFEATISGKDLIVQSPTGSGKTLSFVLPIMNLLSNTTAPRTSRGECSPAVLCLAPTRELALQSDNVFNDFCRNTEWNSAAVYGGQPKSEQARKLSRAGCNIIVATPGRLIDFMESGVITLNNLDYVIFDEMDRMLDMGFQRDLERILRGVYSKKRPQTLMYSATVPNFVKSSAERYLDTNYDHIHVKDGNSSMAQPSTIEHYSLEVDDLSNFATVAKTIQILTQQLLPKDTDRRTGVNRTLVFIQDTFAIERLIDFFPKHKTKPMYGRLSQNQREQTLNSFIAGHVDTLLTTDVIGRGIDIPDVELVVNVLLKQKSGAPRGNSGFSTENYLHRSGRTGRAGKSGRSIAIYDRTRAGDISKVIRESGVKFQQIVMH